MLWTIRVDSERGVSERERESRGTLCCQRDLIMRMRMTYLSLKQFEEYGRNNHIGARAWNDLPIHRIRSLHPPVQPNKAISGVLQVTCPYWLPGHQDPVPKHYGSRTTANRLSCYGVGVYSSAEVLSAYYTALADRAKILIKPERKSQTGTPQGCYVMFWTNPRSSTFTLLQHQRKSFCMLPEK